MLFALSDAQRPAVRESATLMVLMETWIALGGRESKMFFLPMTTA